MHPLTSSDGPDKAAYEGRAGRFVTRILRPVSIAVALCGAIGLFLFVTSPQFSLQSDAGPPDGEPVAISITLLIAIGVFATLLPAFRALRSPTRWNTLTAALFAGALFGHAVATGAPAASVFQVCLHWVGILVSVLSTLIVLRGVLERHDNRHARGSMTT